jgi:hypothetical protein
VPIFPLAANKLENKVINASKNHTVWDICLCSGGYVRVPIEVKMMDWSSLTFGVKKN